MKPGSAVTELENAMHRTIKLYGTFQHQQRSLAITSAAGDGIMGFLQFLIVQHFLCFPESRSRDWNAVHPPMIALLIKNFNPNTV